MVVILVGPAIQIVRVTGWQGRLTLLAFVLVCALANPGRTSHIRAIERTVPEADARQIRELVEYHNFLVFSASSFQGRLVSLGLFGQLSVGSTSCATLSQISVKSPPYASKVKCKS